MQLFDYQRNYLSDLPKNVIMTCDTGVGKTVMAIEHYNRHSEGKPLYVIAPAAKVRTNDWQRTVPEWVKTPPPVFEVMSYERMAKKTDWAEDCCIIADEAHFIKNSESIRSQKFVQVVRNFANQWIGLTATPMANGWQDATGYAALTGFVRGENGKKVKRNFWEEYIRYIRIGYIPKITGYRFEPRLRKWWSSFTKPLERSKEMGITERMEYWVPIDASKAELKRLDQIHKTSMSPAGEELLNISAELACVRKEMAPMRKPALISLLDGTDEHVVVFYNLDAEREVILDAAKLCGRVIYEQSGHRSDLPTKEEAGKMPPSVTVCQYQSAAAGIELQYASILVHFAPTYSYQNYHQANGRIDRIGQNKVPLIYKFGINNTLDKYVWKALAKKTDFSESLFKSNLTK